MITDPFGSFATAPYFVEQEPCCPLLSVTVSWST